MRALFACPRQDARVLRFVPQIRLEHTKAGEHREIVGEQAPLVVRVVAGRRGSAEIGKLLADAGPEPAIRRALRCRINRVGNRRRHWCTSCSVVHFQVPNMIDSARVSRLFKRTVATAGGSTAWKASSCSPGARRSGSILFGWR